MSDKNINKDPSTPVMPPWPVSAGDSWVPFPWSLKLGQPSHPDLRGRPLVVINEGDATIQNVIPGLVVIVLDAKKLIKEVWMHQRQPLI